MSNSGGFSKSALQHRFLRANLTRSRHAYRAGRFYGVVVVVDPSCDPDAGRLGPTANSNADTSERLNRRAA